MKSPLCKLTVDATLNKAFITQRVGVGQKLQRFTFFFANKMFAQLILDSLLNAHRALRDVPTPVTFTPFVRPLSRSA